MQDDLKRLKELASKAMTTVAWLTNDGAGTPVVTEAMLVRYPEFRSIAETPLVTRAEAEACAAASRKLALEEAEKMCQSKAEECEKYPGTSPLNSAMLRTMGYGLRDIAAAIRHLIDTQEGQR